VLYERHAGWLIARLTRRCADQAIVDEVVQDTFLAVWRGARRFRGEGEVAAWIWGIGIRRLLDRFRRRRVPEWRSGGAWSEPSAEELVLLGIEHGDLAGALDRLSPELRSVISATVLDGLTTREAAALLGIPSGTVKSRLVRARRELREALT
jgi:RNA polymerase sigma-70 factor (ECF subfamily)